jgi:hypothetical protein
VRGLNSDKVQIIWVVKKEDVTCHPGLRAAKLVKNKVVTEAAERGYSAQKCYCMSTKPASQETVFLDYKTLLYNLKMIYAIRQRIKLINYQQPDELISPY